MKRSRPLIKSEQQIKLDKKIIPYILSKSPYRRTLSLSIDEKAEIKVSAPQYVAISDIERFIIEKTEWILEKLKDAQKTKEYLEGKKFDEGHQFLFLGKKYPIQLSSTKNKRVAVDFCSNYWNLSIPQGLSDEDVQIQSKVKMIQWYKDQAREVLGGRVFYFSRVIGVQPLDIVLRSQKRRWGSCDYTNKVISLNWQIILSPMDVIDYVVVHELCHLLVPNHSSKFWKKVETFLPTYKIQKKWLKDNLLEMFLP